MKARTFPFLLVVGFVALLYWGLYVPGIGILLSVLSVVPLAIWNALIARRLFRLGRDVSEEVKLRRS